VTALSREEVDRALDRLGADSDRIATSLVEMDSHPGHQLLRSATLTGATADRWAETSTAMATLWEQFATYRGLVDRAREVRARRSRPGDEELAELTTLLTEPVVELNSEEVPIEQRGLTGPSHLTQRITLDELLSRMRKTFTTVIDVLATAESAWSAAIGRIEPLERELHEVSVLAESVAAGDQGVTDSVARLRRDIESARELVLTDVLTAASADPLPAVSVRVAELRTRLGELATLRDSFDTRLAALQEALSDIEAAEITARQTYTAVVEKIANPGLPEPAGDGSARLRPRIGALTGLRDAGDWAALSAEVDRLHGETTAALDAARRALRAVGGLLDRRAELRGRLEAYRVKAARLGYGEDLELERIHKQAQDILFTSPCELPAATRALNRYQQALQDREHPPPASEEGSE
jgi:predicted  nucleic acid-binding Zn-ribbon protein